MGSSIFQGDSVNIDNAAQNLEEEEEVEEIKRRQEEIQSLLTKAMDDFNYDDQSTINSSANEESLHEYVQQYKEVGLENQLQVMYEIRVKEIISLQEKLQAREQQIADMKAQLMQSLMLTEAENDKLRTSLKNSQELLVEKTSRIEQLNNDYQRILVDNESLKQVLNKLELEKASVEYNNQELREQVAILEKGRGTNPLSDAVIQENRHKEISKLQHNLESAFSKNQRLENENTTLTQRLNSIVAEKEDAVANKSEVINKLMQNVDQAQEHNRELLGSVARLTSENERFRVEVQELEANVQMLKGFTDKGEIIKILQKELEKSKHLNIKQTTEFEKLHNEYADLFKQYKEKVGHVQNLEENLAALERKPSSDSFAMQTSNLMESFSVSDKLRDELEMYKTECREKEVVTNSLQSKIRILEEDILSLKRKLELSSKRDSLTSALQEKAARLEEIILNNKKPQTETKSINTDAIRKPSPQKKKATSPKLKDESTAQNTQEVINVMQTKFETDLIEKEIELRKNLQKEFERDYEVLKQKFVTCDKCAMLLKELDTKQLHIQELYDVQAKMLESMKSNANACEMCHDMSLNLMKNVEIIQHQEAELEQYKTNQEKDKKVILQILEEWKGRFEDVEHERNLLKERLNGAMKSFTAAQTELALVKKSEEDLIEIVQMKAKNVVTTWSRHAVELIKAHNTKIRDTKERIDRISWKTDQQVRDIKNKFYETHNLPNRISTKEKSK